jgi:PPOX class probable F420-dependent enzyme
MRAGQPSDRVRSPSLGLVLGGGKREGMEPGLEAALRRAKRIYLTTWSRAGRPGTVPVWFMVKDGRLYFTTLRGSVKARRIKAGARVGVHVGRPDGPGFDGHARWIEERPDLEAEILGVYRRKYPLLVPLFMGRIIARRLARGESVVVEITPSPTPGTA